MVDLTASKTQINFIVRQRDRSELAGDMNAWLKCQGLFLYFQEKMSLSSVAQVLDKSSETVRLWITSYAAEGAKCVMPKLRIGRQPKLSKVQRKSLRELLTQKPCEQGLQGGCWTSAMIQILIKREFGVDYSPKYIPELLQQLGFSFQRAKFESCHLDPVKRKAWMEETWPHIRDLARKTNAKLFFEDESSFAMWGSLFYTWAPRGQQPIVKTTGKRKALKVFGVIEAFTGRLIYQAIEDKLNSESYKTFLRKVLRATQGQVIIIHDGSRYHTSKATKDFVASQARLTLFRLPAYSPDFNPIEGLWKIIKKTATHLMYFPTFEDLKKSVIKALDQFELKTEDILKLFGFYRKLKAL
jgi:transposase